MRRLFDQVCKCRGSVLLLANMQSCADLLMYRKSQRTCRSWQRQMLPSATIHTDCRCRETYPKPAWTRSLTTTRGCTQHGVTMWSTASWPSGLYVSTPACTQEHAYADALYACFYFPDAEYTIFSDSGAYLLKTFSRAYSTSANLVRSTTQLHAICSVANSQHQQKSFFGT
jgi:hypothetical protein